MKPYTVQFEIVSESGHQKVIVTAHQDGKTDVIKEYWVTSPASPGAGLVFVLNDLDVAFAGQ